MASGRSFIITYYGENRPIIGGKCTYLTGQQEICPKTGRKHWQCYAEFNDSIRPTGAGKMLDCEGAHFEKHRYGKTEDMAMYCQKGYTKVEGTEFTEGTMSKQGNRTDLQEVVTMVKENKSLKEIAKAKPETYIRFNKGIASLRETTQTKRDWKMDVQIYWGEPGTGKTFRAYEENKESVFFKPLSKWWDGYDGEKCIIIDDFDPSTMDWSFDYLLRLLDRYPMKVEMKGSSTEFRSKKIIFTSNFDPSTWFLERKNRSAFFRRVTETICFNVTVTK